MVEKTGFDIFAVYLNILAVFIYDDQDFFARLGHVKPFSYLPLSAGFAFQPRRFRRQFCVSFSSLAISSFISADFWALIRLFCTLSRWEK